MKEVFTIVLVIIGALIGAGFASGQEIYSFFYSYGVMGLFGILLTCTLMTILIYKVFKIIKNNKVENYKEFLEVFVKNKKIVKIVDFILNLLLLATFYIMIAGFGAYFEQEIGIEKIIGSIVLVALCMLIFFSNVRGVLKASECIVPILILFIIFIGGINLKNVNITSSIPKIEKNWIVSAVIYCSYNLILLIPVLISLKKEINQNSHIKYIAIIAGLIMATLSMMIFMLLAKSDIDISTLEMPIIYIIRKFFPRFKPIYAFIILASIFTTAISIGMGFLQNVSKSKKSYAQLVTFMCITSLIISNFGFSKLVNFVYPLFGYIGIVQIIYILIF